MLLYPTIFIFFKHHLSRGQIITKNVNAQVVGRVSYPNSIKGSSLETTRSLDGVAMHRIRDPRHDLTRSSNGSNKMGKFHSHVLRSHSCYYCNSSCFVLGIQNIDELHQLTWIHLVTHLFKNIC